METKYKLIKQRILQLKRNKAQIESDIYKIEEGYSNFIAAKDGLFVMKTLELCKEKLQQVNQDITRLENELIEREK